MPWKGTDPRIKRPGLVNDNRRGVPDGYRRCISCRSAKPATTEFFRRRDRSSPYLSSRCLECQRAGARQRMACRRADAEAAKEILAAKRRYEASDHGREQRRTSSASGNHRRRQRLVNAPFDWDSADWAQCQSQWAGCCAYCDSSDGNTQDHFVPICSSAFPGTIPSNMLPACGRCNSSKGRRDPIEWLGDQPERLERILSYLRSVRQQPQGEDMA